MQSGSAREGAQPTAEATTGAATSARAAGKLDSLHASVSEGACGRPDDAGAISGNNPEAAALMGSCRGAPMVWKTPIYRSRTAFGPASCSILALWVGVRAHGRVHALGRHELQRRRGLAGGSRCARPSTAKQIERWPPGTWDAYLIFGTIALAQAT